MLGSIGWTIQTPGLITVWVKANSPTFGRAQLTRFGTSHQKNSIKTFSLSKLRPYDRPIFDINVVGLDMVDRTKGMQKHATEVPTDVFCILGVI
jgi:hypothetical protein